jgi:hypothetical protein
VTLVAGCSREKIDWKSAEAADTVAAYERFIASHPDSELATQARARVAQLAEERDWKIATTTDSPDGYKEFLAKHPNGKWAEEARIRIESAGLAGNPSPLSVNDEPPAVPAASPANTSAAPAAAGTPAAAASRAAPANPAHASPSVAQPAAPRVSQPSASNPSPAASAHPPASTAGAASAAYGIQLGAFTTQQAALAAWKRLQVTHDPELHGLFAHAVRVQTASGQLFRLQSPVGDEARARSICGALAKKSQPCVVVLPDSH